MKLQVLAGALALGLGASALAPVAAHADDRAYRSYRSGGAYRSSSAYRSYRSYGSYHGHSNSYHGYAAYRPYGYRGYAYRPYPYYYGGYAPYVYGAPVAVVPPPYGYRPLVSVQVGGPHFGVWLGF